MDNNLKIMFTALVVATSFLVDSNAEYTRLTHKPKHEDGSLNFIVIGDWGRKGKFNQTLVARQMGTLGEKLDIDFVVSTGDNFYDSGLTGVKDPAFEESFSNVYTAPSLQTKWYSVLGNHDYRGDTQAQLSEELKEKDNRWVCMRSFMLDADTVDFFFVDTTPFVDNYFLFPQEHTYDWRAIYPRKKYLSSVLGDLSMALKNSNAKWKIVVGHHTIKSGCIHGITGELVVHLLPIMKEHKVDFYINGHDHCLERITSVDSDMEFITSGGGSKAWRGDWQGWSEDELKYLYGGQGFLAVQANATTLNFKFVDVFGDTLYEWDKIKELHADI